MKDIDEFGPFFNQLDKLPKPEGLEYDYMQIKRLLSKFTQYNILQGDNQIFPSEYVQRVKKEITETPQQLLIDLEFVDCLEGEERARI